MVVKDIIDILDGEIICEGNLDAEIKTACGSDMMSDVLAFVKDQSVLLTGLVNPQVVRRDITLIKTRYRMFTACGKLYEGGLSGGTAV